MERSTNSKNVDNYAELSKYYDSLLRDDEAFSLWLKYIEEEPFDAQLEYWNLLCGIRSLAEDTTYIIANYAI